MAPPGEHTVGVARIFVWGYVIFGGGFLCVNIAVSLKYIGMIIDIEIYIYGMIWAIPAETTILPSKHDTGP